MKRIGIKEIFAFFDKIKKADVPFVPNLILPIDRSNGRSFVTKAFVEAIEEKRYFSATDKYLEFDFDENDYSVNSIREMIGTIQTYSGTKNEFEGVLAIGVDVFCEHSEEYPTRFFLKKVKEMSEHVTFIFFVSRKYKENTFIRRLKEVEPVYYIDSDYSSDEIAEIAFENVSKLVPKILEKEQKKEALENAFRCKKIKNIKEATAFLKKLILEDLLNEEGV